MATKKDQNRTSAFKVGDLVQTKTRYSGSIGAPMRIKAIRVVYDLADPHDDMNDVLESELERAPAVLKRTPTKKTLASIKGPQGKKLAPRFASGAIVKYAVGATALMRIEGVFLNHGPEGQHYYAGEQFYGGTVFAYEYNIELASEKDLRKWSKSRQGASKQAA
jgi:hypothetical protein